MKKNLAKRIFPVIVIISLIFLNFNFVDVKNALAADPTPVAPTTGSGTEGDPYEIETWENLYWITQDTSRWDKHYIQTANIDFDEADPAITSWDSGAGWTPIGNDSTNFTGAYDGQNYSISNLYIDRASTDHVGLFGYASAASFSSTNLIDVEIYGHDYVGALGGIFYQSSVTDSSSGGSVDARQYVGGMIGFYHYDWVFDTELSDSYSTASVYGSGATNGMASVGGLVGYSRGIEIIRTFATGSVGGDGNSVGGLVGQTYGGNGISQSFALGDVTNTGEYSTGGLVGNNESALSNSYAKGDVSGDKHVGGLVGYNSFVTIEDSYSTGSVSGNSTLGGFLGANNSGTINTSFWDTETSGIEESAGGTGKTTAQMKTESTFTDAGWNFTEVWGIDGGYPYLTEALSYTLTYSAGTGGTVTGESPQNVNYGEDGTEVTAVADTGYSFVDWSDGSVENPRTDTNVTADISVTANFSANSYTLTYNAGEHGSISGNSPQTVTYGNDGSSVTAVPETGYSFANWSDGSTDNPRVDSNVSDDITVTANFSINSYTLTYNSGAHGSITGDSHQVVEYGQSGTAVIAEPEAGYIFSNWSDGSTDNPRTDSGITSDMTVKANFVADKSRSSGEGFVSVMPYSNGGPQVRTFLADGSLLSSFMAYDESLRGEFDVVTANLSQRDSDEIITLPGVGFSSHLKVFRYDGSLLAETMVYDNSFRGGIEAIAGDFNGDGLDEIAVAPKSAGGPHIKIYRLTGNGLALMGDFFAYDKKFRGGLNLVSGRVDYGVDRDYLIVAPKVNNTSHVKVFCYEDGNFSLKGSTFVYNDGFRGGVNLATGDLDGNGQDEIITAPEINGGPNVRVYSYNSGSLSLLDWVFAYQKSFYGGVNLETGDINGNGHDELIVTPASDGGPNLRIYTFGNNDLSLLQSLFVYDKGFRGGVNTVAKDLNNDGKAEIVTVPTANSGPNTRILSYTDRIIVSGAFWAYERTFRGGVNLSAGTR